MTVRTSAPPRAARAAVPLMVLAILAFGFVQPCLAQTEGKAALDVFVQWKRAPGNSELGFGDALRKYHEKLTRDGLPKETADRILNLITAYDEAELYNQLYAARPEFNTRPNPLLVDATEGLRPGQALDVGMGQGRNSLYLARKGWTVTGFDVAEVGLKKAREQATAEGVTITAMHASDVVYRCTFL